MKQYLAVTACLALLGTGMASMGHIAMAQDDGGTITGGQTGPGATRHKIQVNTDQPLNTIEELNNGRRGTDPNASPTQAISPDASRIEVPLDYFSNPGSATPAGAPVLNGGVAVPPQSATVQRVSQRKTTGVSAQQLQTYSNLRLVRVDAIGGKAEAQPVTAFHSDEVLTVDSRNIPRLAQRQPSGSLVVSPAYRTMVSGNTVYFIQSGLSVDALRAASLPTAMVEAPLPGAVSTDTRISKGSARGKAVGIIAPEGWRTINVGQATLSIDPNGIVRDVVPR